MFKVKLILEITILISLIFIAFLISLHLLYLIGKQTMDIIIIYQCLMGEKKEGENDFLFTKVSCNICL